MLSIHFSVEVVPAANSAGLSQEVRDIAVTGPAANSAGPAVVRGVTANSFGPATSSQFYRTDSQLSSIHRLERRLRDCLVSLGLGP